MGSAGLRAPTQYAEVMGRCQTGGLRRAWGQSATTSLAGPIASEDGVIGLEHGESERKLLGQ